MENSEIILHNTVLDNVLRYLYVQVKTMSGRSIEYTRLVEYPDGTSNNVTYSHMVQYVQPPKNNRIEVKFTYGIFPEGKTAQAFWDLMPAIEFEGWQLQTTTVLIKAEFQPLYKSFVDGFWDDLNKTFEQVVQPAREETVTETNYSRKGGPLPPTDEEKQAIVDGWYKVKRKETQESYCMKIGISTSAFGIYQRQMKAKKTLNLPNS